MTEVVVIGASRGGLHAVSAVLSGLPRDFPAPVVVVQHRAEGADDLLAGLLDRAGPLPVADAEDKSPLVPGAVMVAPGGYHLLVESDHVTLSTEGQVRQSRPAIDVTLQSAAESLGAGVIGVVLTGNNDDGADGLAEVRRRGGIGVVQDPESSESPTMPAAARDRGRPQVVAALEEIAPLLVRLSRGPE